MKSLRMPSVFLLWSLATVFAGFAPSVSAQAIDKATFEALDQPGRTMRVLVGLEKREQQLQNLSYSVELSTTNVGPNDSHRFMDKEKQEVKRIAEKHLVRDVRYEFYKEDGKIEREVLSSWDGREGRSLMRPPYSWLDTPVGGVQPSDTDAYSSTFHQLLGLSMRFRQERLTAPAWLSAAILNADSVNLSWVEWKGDGAIQMLVDDYYVHWKVILDPQHGFMPRYFERTYINPNGIVSNWWTGEANDIRKVGETWVPNAATIELGTVAYREISVISVKAGDFALNSLKDQDLRIEFPDGTHVVDAIRRISYTVKGDKEIDVKPVDSPQLQRPAGN